jgi:EpsI family protein
MEGGAMKWTRAGVAAILLTTMMAVFHTVSHGENIPLHRALATFPKTIGEWQGHNVKLDGRYTDALKADDVLTRGYESAGNPTVWLYVAYFQSQRQGQTIHSPKNCLPGSGWTPVNANRLSMEVGGGESVRLNRYVVQNGLERQLVLYWYQSHGRTVASEYEAKVDMALDAIRMNRTDGALVRVSLPIEDGDDMAAQKVAREFVMQIYPALKEYIPQ